MAKVANKNEYKKQTVINGKDYWIITDHLTGKTKHVEVDDVSGNGETTESTPSNRIRAGRASWWQNMQFRTTQVISVFNGVQYDNNATIQTLSPAHATLNRYDIITMYLSDDQQSVSVQVRQGQNALHPVVPTVSFADRELVLTVVRVSAGSTSPDGVYNTLVFDENVGEPTEFTASETSGGSGIVIGNGEHPNSGALGIKVNYNLLNAGEKIIFATSTDGYEPDNYTSFDFFVYIGTDISGLIERIPEVVDAIQVKFFNGANQLGSTTQVKQGQYGLDLNQFNSQQLISIPIIDFNTLGLIGVPEEETNITSIEISFSGTISSEIFLDEFKLQSGVPDPVTPNSYLGLDDVADTEYLGKEGFTPIVRNGNLKLERGALLSDSYLGSKVIRGDYTHVAGTDRTFDFWASMYMVDNELFANENDYLQAQLTLPVAPTTIGHERIDVVVVRVGTAYTDDPAREIVLIEGVAGVDPVAKPPIDLSKEAELTFFISKYGETTPVEIDSNVAYNENAEWANIQATSGVDLDYPTLPYSGAKCIYFPKGSKSAKVEMAWQNGSPIPYSIEGKVSFSLYLSQPLKKNSSIEVTLKNGISIMGSITMNYKALYQYGYNPSTYTGWSVISIPYTEFLGFSRSWSEHDIIEIKLANTAWGKLDMLMFQEGTISKTAEGVQVKRTSQLINDGENGKLPFLSHIKDGTMLLIKGAGRLKEEVEVSDTRMGWFTPARFVIAIYTNNVGDGDLTNENNYLFLLDNEIS